MPCGPYLRAFTEKVPRVKLDSAARSTSIGLRLGVVALALCWIPLLGAACGLAAQVYAVRGSGAGDRPAPPLHPARVGLVLSSVATTLGVLVSLELLT